MLKYLVYSKEKFKKGSGLDYPKNEELTWILATNPTEEELRAIERDFELYNYLGRYSKETRSLKYSNDPLILALVDYYLEGSNIAKSRILCFINPKTVLIITETGEKYFSELFDTICERFEKERKKDINRLFYDFLDRDINENYDILTKIDDDTSRLEVASLRYNDEKNIQNIINLKRELNKMTRRFWSTAKIIFSIRKETTALKLTPDGMHILDEIYENLIHQIDILSTQKESLIDALTIYETTVSNQLAKTNNDINVVMKRLTILTLLLMIPTLIAGIYGMNFKYIPELTSPYGFFEAIIVMLIASSVVYLYSKKKKWI